MFRNETNNKKKVVGIIYFSVEIDVSYFDRTLFRHIGLSGIEIPIYQQLRVKQVTQ